MRPRLLKGKPVGSLHDLYFYLDNGYLVVEAQQKWRNSTTGERGMSRRDVYIPLCQLGEVKKIIKAAERGAR